MTHHREELALGAVGRLGEEFFGLPERGFGELPLGEIDIEGVDSDLVVGESDGLSDDLNRVKGSSWVRRTVSRRMRSPVAGSRGGGGPKFGIEVKVRSSMFWPTASFLG